MCIFCDISNKIAEASIIAESSKCLAFLSIHPVNTGELIVSTKDHFKDVPSLPDDVYMDLMSLVKEMSQALKKTYSCDNIGWVVHNFMVQHAHITILPQYSSSDITSLKWIKVINNEAMVEVKDAPIVSRESLEIEKDKIRGNLDDW